LESIPGLHKRLKIRAQDEGRQLPETLAESMPRRLTEDIALDGPQQSIENYFYITEIKYFLPLNFFLMNKDLLLIF
jgi:hypothetical protein